MLSEYNWQAESQQAGREITAIEMISWYPHHLRHPIRFSFHLSISDNWQEIWAKEAVTITARCRNHERRRPDGCGWQDGTSHVVLVASTWLRWSPAAKCHCAEWTSSLECHRQTRASSSSGAAVLPMHYSEEEAETGQHGREILPSTQVLTIYIAWNMQHITTIV